MIARKYAKRIFLHLDELQLVIMALEHYSNRTLEKERDKLLERLKDILGED